ncbi:MAG: SIS domain-containing protein [Deltaproteobacteria bacterium]|nr:SIS domain-containing protein [Deltaproteobacteria bacterium]
MRLAVAQFFEHLGQILRNVQVCDGSGVPLDFSAGVQRGIDLIVAQTITGRKLMFIGNGASAAISSHQSVDYWKTGGMRAVAFNDPALLTCISNDFGYPFVFEKPIEMFADPGDVLVAISSSGRSENILKGARTATEKGCYVITMSGFNPDNPLRRLGDLNFYVPSKSYGHVEIIHLSLSHCILDTIRSVYGSPPRIRQR